MLVNIGFRAPRALTIARLTCSSATLAASNGIGCGAAPDR
jgi:hypothetical protein